MSLAKTFFKKNYIYIIRTTRQLVIVYYSFVFVSKNKLKKTLKNRSTNKLVWFSINIGYGHQNGFSMPQQTWP